VGVADALHLHHDASRAAGLAAEVHLDVLGPALRVLYLLHAVEELLLAAGLGRLGRLGAVLLDEALQLGAALGVRLRLAGELLGAGLLFLYVAAVVAGVAVYASVFQLQDRARDGVQEVAVVGDYEDGALGVLHEAFEPLDGLEVEVVRRLVQQDQVWLLQQQPREGHPALLPARERPDRSLPVLGRET